VGCVSATAPARTPGLTSAEAADLLTRVGPNVLPHSEQVPVWRRLAKQFVHFFALLLWVAAALALVGGMPALGAAIVAVVLVNGVFAFVQENRAEHAAAGLRDLLPVYATVLRDGQEQQVTADLIVPGDVVMLVAGDRITADMTCLEAQSALVDTSTLTGESAPREATAGDEVFAGCFLVQGRVTAHVAATGARTRLGGIAKLTQQPRPATPLERDIAHLVRMIAIIAGAVGVGFFALMLALGVPASDGFIFGIGVTVALVPEGLLPTVTLSLAIGAQRMAGQNALVRRLESVETLGATTFICTDKTGTLTENQMNVVSIWTPAGEAHIQGHGFSAQAEVRLSDPQAAQAVHATAIAAALASPPPEWVGAQRVGDPVEVAIAVLVQRLGIVEEGTAEGYLPFDVHRRLAVALMPDRLVCKGAPEAILAACDAVPATVDRALETLLARGLRVLAVAQGPRNVVAPPGTQGTGVLAHLTLLGLLGFHDPPREGVTQAITECRLAGVKLAMITGDHPTTARRIADQIGLALPDSPVLVADELPDDIAVMGAMVDHDGVVLARADPEDKLRIARALQARGHIVAMTGDGVNDAPALKMADIGIAMGRSGTEVAREAADLVLLDDHFATIVAAVRQGRETFLNVRRFLTYHLTDNVAELAPFLLWALSGGRFPLALGVMQILALDLGTDTLPATALGAERAGARVLDHPPVSGRLLDRTVAWRAFGILGPTEAVAEIAVFTAALWAAGWRLGESFPHGSALAAASGGAFLTVVVMQMANSFACRSTSHPAWRLPWTSNRFLLVAVATSTAFALTCLVVDPIARLLGQAWPPATVLPMIALSAPLLLGVDAAWKKWLRHRM
jgi:magnesium-transporting ATPase (P-type)